MIRDRVLAVGATELPLTMAEIRLMATIRVEQAGTLLGMARGTAYKAAKRGDIPTIRMGRRLLVPVPALLALLGEQSSDR